MANVLVPFESLAVINGFSDNSPECFMSTYSAYKLPLEGLIDSSFQNRAFQLSLCIFHKVTVH